MVCMESTIMLDVGQIAYFSVRKYMHDRKILNSMYFLNITIHVMQNYSVMYSSLLYNISIK